MEQLILFSVSNSSATLVLPVLRRDSCFLRNAVSNRWRSSALCVVFEGYLHSYRRHCKSLFSACQQGWKFILCRLFSQEWRLRRLRPKMHMCTDLTRKIPEHARVQLRSPKNVQEFMPLKSWDHELRYVSVVSVSCCNCSLPINQSNQSINQNTFVCICRERIRIWLWLRLYPMPKYTKMAIQWRAYVYSQFSILGHRARHKFISGEGAQPPPQTPPLG